MTKLRNLNGEVIKDYSYTPYGKEKETALEAFGGSMTTALWQQEESTIDNPFRYCGEYLDDATGLYYLRARDYDPETQTFLTEDTCNGETNDPLSLNLYTYAENDPIQNVDPTGHWIVDAVFLAADAVSFAKKPSLAGAAWIAADVLSFADPTGAASTAAHIVKEVHVAAEVAHEAGAAKKVLEVAKKATTKGAGNAQPYSHLQDSKSVGTGKNFTKTQKANIIAENIKKNGGVVKSDASGQILSKPQKSQSSVKPNPKEWQVDHITSKKKGGSNSYSNAQVLSRKENRAKWDK